MASASPLTHDDEPFEVMSTAIALRPRLLMRALELYRHHADAEDAVSDVFLKLCSKPPKPMTPAQLHHWLRTVLMRQQIDEFRRRTSRRVLVEEVVSLDVLTGWTG